MRWRRERSCGGIGIRRPGDFLVRRTYIQIILHIYIYIGSGGGGGGGGVIERYIAAPNEVLFGRNRYHGYDCGRLSAAAAAVAAASRHLHRHRRGRHPNRRHNHYAALALSVYFPSSSRRMPNTNAACAHTHARANYTRFTSRRGRVRAIECACVYSRTCVSCCPNGWSRCAANHCTQPRFLLLPPRCTAHAVRPYHAAAAESDRRSPTLPRSVSIRHFAVLYYYYTPIGTVISDVNADIRPGGIFVAHCIHIGIGSAM